MSGLLAPGLFLGSRSVFSSTPVRLHAVYPRLCECGIVHRRPVEVPPSILAVLYANNAKNLMLDALTAQAPYLGLHTGYPAATGNEASGGGYGRFLATWAAAGASIQGVVQLTNPTPAWSVPATITTYRWWGGWSAVTAGTNRFTAPVGGGTIFPASAEVSGDITGDTIVVPGAVSTNAFTAGQYIVIWGTGPTGIVQGTIYRIASTNLAPPVYSLVQETDVPGAAVINLTGTAPFAFYVQPCTPIFQTAAGQVTMSSGQLDLNLIS